MVQAYKRQSLSGGFTRVEMLVQVYDRAICAVEACEIAVETKDDALFSRHIVIVHKAIVALHAGLKPEEDEVAFNVARLLHFVAVQVGEQNWKTAHDILTQLRDSFSAVIDEANQLESEGVIPAMPMQDSYESLA